MRLSQKQIFLLIGAAIVTLTVVAYEPIRHNDFVNYDDDKYITKNPEVTGGITWQSVTWAFTKFHSSNWHPLTWLSHMLDCEIYGLNPVGHHITNVLIHTVNSILLFWLLTRITGAIWASGFAAAVFALHPVHVESVAWAAERKDVLSGLFWILTILAYVRYTERLDFKRYAVVLLTFVLGLLSKPMIVTLPFVLVLLDYWPLERVEWGHNGIHSASSKEILGHKVTVGRLIVEKIPLLALSAISSVVTIISQRSGGAIVELEKVPVYYRIANAFISYINYIYKTIWPSRLAVIYPHFQINIPIAKTLLCVLVFVIATVIIIRGHRRKYLTVGWLWYVGTLVPVIGLVQVGSQAMANRYMYIPMAGLLIIICWAVKDLIANRPRLRIVTVISAAIVLLSTTMLTRMQVSRWQNSLTLFDYTLKSTENNFMAENNYGKALYDAGRFDDAELHLNNSIRIYPSCFDTRVNLGKTLITLGKLKEAEECFNELLTRYKNSPAAYYYLGLAYSYQGKFNDAIKCFNKVTSTDPDYENAQKRTGIAMLATGRINEASECFAKLLRKNDNSAEINYNMALAESLQQKYDDTIRHLKRVLVLDPNYPGARYRMGLALIATNKPNEAIACFNDVLRQNRNSAEVHYNLAIALGMQKKYDEAMKYLNKAMELDPNNSDIHNKMGMALLATGRPGEAIIHFKYVLQTNKIQSEVYENLGSAYIQVGKYDLAIQNLTKAIELKPNNISLLNNLAWVLATVNDVSIQNANKAIEYAQLACELTGNKEAGPLDTLGAAYAAAGKFEEAKTIAAQALNIAKTSGQVKLAGEIENRIKLYEAGQPYRQTQKEDDR